MSKPTLYVFAISHYCEKARWALEYLDIDFEVVYLAPGLHTQLAHELDLKQASLPILKTGDTTIQGSNNIIDWADNNARNEKTLTPESCSATCRALEQKLDDVMGVNVRRYFYSEALVEHPETVEPIFTRDLPADQQATIKSIWEMITANMIKGMDLGSEQGDESKIIVDVELTWLEALLADGRAYLAGDHFSRADLTAASLCAPIARAEENPSNKLVVLPPRFSQVQEQWNDRPALRWVRQMYNQHRHSI